MPTGNWKRSFDAMERQLKGLQAIPEQAITAAQAVVESEIPVYTGTYQAAVVVADAGVPGEYTAVVLMVDQEDLQASAQAHAAVIEEEFGLTPEEYVGDPPYPEHIESHGSPTGKGQGMWEQAAEAAKSTIQTMLGRL